MAVNNSFGNILRTTIFGASHAEEVGVIVEGVPWGITLREEMFAQDLNRRRPQRQGETTRCEADTPIVEGLSSESVTTGERITIRFRNSNRRSDDYAQFELHPRPSHADLVQRRKYGKEYDISGGGMASGRMTVALVAAGVVAKQIIPEVTFHSRLVEVGGCCDVDSFDDVISAAAREGDSVGGVVECVAHGVKGLLGEPFFDSAESMISHLLFSIPGVKGVEFGDGFESARRRGSERNDVIVDSEGHTATNSEGGINGGITNGNDIVVRVAMKPTPSIAKAQHTYHLGKERVMPLVVGGRHDACIARRAVVVVEAMVALALAELKLR